MKASLVELDLEQVDSSGKLMGEGRSEGIHLSQIIRWAREKLEGPIQQTGNEHFMTMGFLLEVILERGFKLFGSMMRKDRSKIVRPGEFELDGIYMTPDGLGISEEAVIEEYKATYKSLARLTGTNPDKGDCAGDVLCWLKRFHWWWLVQIMAYCWAVGTEKARLIVWFANGDYSHKPPFGGPQVIVVELEFTLEELQANWTTVLQYRDEMDEMAKDTGAA